MENTPKPKKETVEVDKEFILKMAKQLGEVKNDLNNYKSLQELNNELKKIAPPTINMTKIYGKPTIDVEVNFIQPLTLDQIKEAGYKFQQELEVLLEKHGIQSMKLTYNREIR